MIKMKEIGTISITFVEDRGLLKERVNFVKDKKIVGFLKPVRHF